MDSYKVVIIGAGISGLSAARHLLKNGINSLLILEAGESPGGRIKTINFGSGIAELGAQWIHGEQNEFCQLVKSSGHRHSKPSWEGKGDFLCKNGEKIPSNIVDEVLGWIEDTIEKVEATFSIETFQQNGMVKTSMGEFLSEKFSAYLKDSEFEEDSKGYAIRLALFQWGMSFQRIDNSCNKMNHVSLFRWSEFEVNPGEHYNNFGRGAQAFIDEALVGGDSQVLEKIRFNSPVKNVEWGGRQVKITGEDGKIFLAETVIITCSIAVLKSNMKSFFTPNLPDKLEKAIKATGYGPVTKIFLKWEEPWWPNSLKGFQLVWPNEFIDCCGKGEDEEEMGEKWHKTITGFDPVLNNPNVLLGWLGGPEAVYVEGLSEKEIGRKCSEMLRNFTGLNVPEVEAVAVSKWNTNKYFQGAYSFRSVDGDLTSGDICSILCEPIKTDESNKPVILFAGEALSKTHYSTLHGAYESGISQAMKIIQYLNQIANKTCVREKDIINYANKDVTIPS